MLFSVRLRRACAAIGFAASLGACASRPVQQPRARRALELSPVVGQIETGRSTPDDVFALLGEPYSRMTDSNGLEQWVYWSTEEVGGRYAHTRIVVEFGPEGTVRRVASARVAP